MATLFTIIGACDPSVSANRQSEKMAKAVNGRRDKLDWFRNGRLLWRCIPPKGPIATHIAPALGVGADMACIFRLDKSTPPEDCWPDLADLVLLFGETAALIQSDGTVLCVKLGADIWISDMLRRTEQPNSWTTFAMAHFGNQAQFWEQADIQERFPKGAYDAAAS